MTLTVGSLFSGIGGLDLGLERAGMKVVWQSEIAEYPSRVLAKHWPDVPNLGDITTIDWSIVPRVDLICGGYPCQPFSLAGARKGAKDVRHLWPYFAEALRNLRPRYALLENVRGHLSLGFGQVLADLAALGFDAEWDIVPAATVGAPHRRDRLFVVAYANGNKLRQQQEQVTWSGDTSFLGHDGTAGSMANAYRLVGPPPGSCDRQCGEVGQPEAVERAFRPPSPRWNQWTVEPDVGRVADGIPARVDRLKALGNAVVPQVAEHVGRLILDFALVGEEHRAAA